MSSLGRNSSSTQVPIPNQQFKLNICIRPNLNVIMLTCQCDEDFYNDNTHYRFEIRQNSVKSTVRSEIDHFRCKIGSGW